MPKYNDPNIETFTLPLNTGNMTYTGFKPEKLSFANAYTLASLVVDTTGSLQGYESNVKEAIVKIIEGLKKDTYANNIILRLTYFAHGKINEIIGFTPITQIDINNIITPTMYGQTNLTDAIIESIQASRDYAKTLKDNDYPSNACIYVPTDGDDNASSNSNFDLINLITEVTDPKKETNLESIRMDLVGITSNKTISTILEKYKNECKFDDYIDAGDLDDSTVLRIVNHASKTFSSTSQMLGSGQKSQSLSF